MKEIGIQKCRVDPSKIAHPIKNIESGYGISQCLDRKFFMPVAASGYGHGTYYGNHVHHLWYGSYRKRDTLIDNVDPKWMDFEASRLVADYWKNKFDGPRN
jgi:hypothetical protein